MRTGSIAACHGCAQRLQREQAPGGRLDPAEGVVDPGPALDAVVLAVDRGRFQREPFHALQPVEERTGFRPGARVPPRAARAAPAHEMRSSALRPRARGAARRVPATVPAPHRPPTRIVPGGGEREHRPAGRLQPALLVPVVAPAAVGVSPGNQQIRQCMHVHVGDVSLASVNPMRDGIRRTRSLLDAVVEPTRELADLFPHQILERARIRAGRPTGTVPRHDERCCHRTAPCSAPPARRPRTSCRRTTPAASPRCSPPPGAWSRAGTRRHCNSARARGCRESVGQARSQRTTRRLGSFSIVIFVIPGRNRLSNPNRSDRRATAGSGAESPRRR